MPRHLMPCIAIVESRDKVKNRMWQLRLKCKENRRRKVNFSRCMRATAELKLLNTQLTRKIIAKLLPSPSKASNLVKIQQRGQVVAMQQTPLHCIKPSSASTTISNYWFLVSLPASNFAGFLSCVPSRKQRKVDNGRPNQIIAHVPWMLKEARRPQLWPPTTMRARRSGAKSITVWRIITILFTFESSTDTLDL